MTDQTSTWQRSTTRRFLKWLFSWRTARRALIGLASLVTLGALFCTEENIRGRLTWNRYRRELEVHGEQLDFKAFIPKPIPDEQNFAVTPLIQSWFPKNAWGFHDDYTRAEAKVKVDKDHRAISDLVAWERAFNQTNSSREVESGPLDPASRASAARTVLEGLETNAAMFAELRAVSQRPQARYPVNYDLEDPWAILIPHIGSVRQVCRRLQLKACAELAVGQTDAACEDVKLMLRLSDSLKDESFLISHLVRFVCLQHALQPVWEGLADHRWSDAQLRVFQAHLQQYNFIADVQPGFAAERAAGIVTAEQIRQRGLTYLADVGSTVPNTELDRLIQNLVSLIIPLKGWTYFEQCNSVRAGLALVNGTMDPSQGRVFPSRVKTNVREFDQSFAGGKVSAFVHHRMLAALILPALNNIISRASAAQTSANEAALACAFERYRIANGQFPEKLDALVPAFISPLPHDVITGEPYKYRRTDDGQFVLYSVGWNEKDDGGVPGKTDFDDREGDWVWQYPAR